MAIDEALSERMRAATDGLPGMSEKKMMGGMCFMLEGNMLGGAHREKTGEQLFMFRVGKENEAEAMTRPGATPLVMGGRKMGGMVFVDAEACDDTALRDWVALALDFVGGLPPK